MSNLKTNYMGIELKNPVVLGACNFTTNPDRIKQAEDAGVGAIVYKSLFEEQIQLESFKLDEKLNEFNDLYYEMITIHPNIEHAGADEHLYNLRKARESVSIPLFASLNAVNIDSWVKYAVLLAETGVDGIELNFYQIPMDFDKTAGEIEDAQINAFKAVRKHVSVPISVKLSADYSNLLNFVKRLDEAGANAVVLFNSFFQPDINISLEKHIRSPHLSHPGDYKKSLRYAGLLYGNVKADVCSSLGVFNSDDVIKLLLAGSACVQVVSTVYKNGLHQISNIIKETEAWMTGKNYNSIDEFRGKLSKNKLIDDPFVYKRAQYVDMIMNSDDLFIGGTNQRINPPN
jgi:dihydroorotate dehydrogenase (fumarate)